MIKNYLKIAWRNLWKQKFFSLINIMGLAVGMSGCFLIYLYVHFETHYDAFNTKADRIYRVVTDIKTPSDLLQWNATSAPVAINMQKDFPEVEAAVRVSNQSFLVRKGNEKFQEKNSFMADSTLFKIFDFPLVYGDKNTALKEPMSIVFSQTAAKKYFGNTNPVGQNVLLTGDAINATVTGVMKDAPENSQIKADMIVSMSSQQKIYKQSQDSLWGGFNVVSFLLLKPGSNAKALEAKFPAFIELHDGKEMKEINNKFMFFLEPLKDIYLYSKRDDSKTGHITNVYIFSIVAVFLLLIACINFINLTTARSVERAKEVGIRKVSGAGKLQLARQFIGESLVICLLSFIVAVFLCALLLPLFNNLAGKQLSTPFFQHPLYLVNLLLVSVSIGFMAGIYPAIVLSSFQPVVVLKGAFKTGTKGVLLRKGLVVFQFTISIALIIGIIVVYTQLNFMRSQDLGFDKNQTIIIDTNADKNKDAFKESLAAVPGVLSTSLSSSVPGSGGFTAYSKMENKDGDIQVMNLDVSFVDFDFINQYKMKIVAGRGFSKAFATDTTKAMIVNEAAVKSLGYSSPQQIIGKKFDQWGRTGKVIGVVKDFHYQGLQTPIKAMSLRIEPNSFYVISIKTAAKNLPATIAAIESKWNQIIPNRPFEYTFLDEKFDKQYRSEDRFKSLFFYFAALAIFISCLGLLGLASYSTFQRTKEIGVRKVLGASIFNVLNLLSVDFLKLVLIAFIIACQSPGFLWRSG
jgi:putative ABC transport system permease protein